MARLGSTPAGAFLQGWPLGADRRRGFGAVDRAVAHSGAGATQMSRKTTVQSYLRTEHGNAEMFAAAYGQVLKFDHKQSRWLIWNEKRGRWLEDKQHKVRMLM